MKALNTAIVDGHTISVLMEVLPGKRAAISYFINGSEQTDWSRVKPLFQDILTVLADDICRGHCLTKYSY